MGTYTTNYQLFMPSIGEQGWGELVNGNFTTIDITMGDLNTRLTAVENEVDGNLSCTSVTTSGTITSTGLITANGGIKGNLNGNATTATTATKANGINMPTLSYSGTFTIDLKSGTDYTLGQTFYATFLSSPFPFSGKISAKYSGTQGYIEVISSNGKTTLTLTNTQQE